LGQFSVALAVGTIGQTKALKPITDATAVAAKKWVIHRRVRVCTNISFGALPSFPRMIM
jgi:hypothetical protein